MNLCLHSNKPIRSGRSDKKFCDAACKDAYYNARKIQEHREIKKIDTILKRNRRVLRKFYNPNRKEELIQRDQLMRAGFDFGFHTHSIVTKKKANEFIFCYDYGYREVIESKFQVIHAFQSVR